MKWKSNFNFEREDESEEVEKRSEDFLTSWTIPRGTAGDGQNNGESWIAICKMQCNMKGWI